MECHAVVAVGSVDDQACAPDLRVPPDDRGNLRGVHEHSLDLGRLIGAAEPALDAHVGAATRRYAGKRRRQVAGCEADQRVVKVRQRRDDDFADLARRDRVTRARAHDLDEHPLVDNQAVAGG